MGSLLVELMKSRDSSIISQEDVLKFLIYFVAMMIQITCIKLFSSAYSIPPFSALRNFLVHVASPKCPQLHVKPFLV
jgi:hypothetical protein